MSATPQDTGFGADLSKDEGLSGRAPKTYTKVQIILHWSIAALVAVQLFFNDDMQIAFDARVDRQDAQTDGLWLMHLVVGSMILGLMGLRLGLRLIGGSPPPPANNPKLVIWFGAANHLALYLLLLLMPVTGLIAWFGLNDLASELHELGSSVLLAIIALHIIGALFEHMILKQNVFERMKWGSHDRTQDDEEG